MKEYYYGLCEHLEAITGVSALDLFDALLDWVQEHGGTFAEFARETLDHVATL